MGAALSFLGQKLFASSTLISARFENISCCASVAAVHPPVVRRTGGFLKKRMTTIYVGSRKRVAALGTLNWALLPEGAYTGARLAAWISSNFATATYSKTTNSLSVAYDGNRLILNNLELRQQFPDAADYPAAPPASPTKPLAWTTCWAQALSPAGSRSLSSSG